MREVIAKYKASCVLMHIKGTRKNMQESREYKDLIAEVLLYFEKAVWTANCVGIRQIIVDPGIGFGKTPEHNLMMIKNIYEFKKLDCPVMIGISRKSFIGKILGGEASDRLEGTLALDTISILNGANILRVHDVKEAVRAARITDSYKKI